VGFFYIDTTTYSTGTHSIQWTARDSANNTDGIGSRFFTIQNAGSDLARARDNGGSRVSGSRFGVNTLRFNAGDINVQRLPSDVSTPVWIRTGYERSTALLPVYPDDNGVITIPMKELERVEIHFFADGETGNTGVAAVNGSSLPVGSTLDGSRGIFYWQSGLAYLGDYPLQFIKAGKNGWFKKDIVVRINPKH
ncbi:MAG: hypothetical protein GY940_29280, partial [bacterium]|nr:hypothetical protein [bacterium]